MADLAYRVIPAAIVMAALCAPSHAQVDAEALSAFVTAVGSGGAERVAAEGTTPITNDGFSFEQARIGPGEGVRTGPDGSVTLTLPHFGAVVSLGASTELRLEQPIATDGGVHLILRLESGRAWFLRKADSAPWWLIAAGDGYTISRSACLFVEVQPGGATFSVRSGEAAYFQGRVPARPPIDASGTFTKPAARQLTPDGETGLNISPQWAQDVRVFARARGAGWLKEAEKGDFTPARTESRAAPEPLSGAFQSTLKFVVPTVLIAAAAPRPAPSAVRGSLSPSQALIESGVPGTVIAGQRFRRSRIIGNPGTSGTGSLVVNPAAELAIILGRR